MCGVGEFLVHWKEHSLISVQDVVIVRMRGMYGNAKQTPLKTVANSTSISYYQAF